MTQPIPKGYKQTEIGVVEHSLEKMIDAKALSCKNKFTTSPSTVWFSLFAFGETSHLSGWLCRFCGK